MLSNLKKRLPFPPDTLPFRNLVMYFLAVGLNRGMPFLLIPLLTNYLDPDEYGIVSLAAVIIGLLKNIIGLNPSVFVVAKYYVINREDWSDYIYNSIILAIVSALMFFCIFLVPGMHGSLFPDRPTIFLVLIFVTALFAVIETVILTIIQMEKRGRLFLVFNLASALLQVFFIYIFVVQARANWQGKLIGDFLAETIICVMLLVYSSRKYTQKISVSFQKIKELVTFSLPFLPHSISLWAMNFIDRFFLEKLVGIQSVGLYSAAYNLGLGLMLIYDSLQRTWQPYFFESLSKNNENEKKIMVKLTWLYYLFAIILFLAATCIAYLAFPYIFGKDFRNAFEFIPLIFLGYTFQGMYRVVAGYLYHLNKNGSLAFITTSSAILNVILNYWLISRHGAIGAAQSTAITFVYMFVFVKIVVVKTGYMPWFRFTNPVNRGLNEKK